VFCSYSLYPVITFQEDSKDLPGRFFILDRNGEVITDKSYKNGYYKPLETKINIENKFIQELILVEDKNYFSHF
jgi:membrane carboxypeptidase/penicillin-binding protein PbpC